MNGSSYIDLYTKIIAFYSPKCACTAVDHWFAKGVLALNPELKQSRQQQLESIDFIDEGKPRIYLNSQGFKYSYEQSLRHIESSGYFVVHFTRHPATRLVSAFLNKFVVGRGKRLVEFNSLEPFAKDLVERVYSLNNWGKQAYKGIRFVDLVNFLYLAVVNPNQSTAPEISYVDHHWDTQLPRHCRRGITLKPNYIVHTETFDDDLRILNSRFGLEIVPEIYNRATFGGTRTTADDLSETFSTELAAGEYTISPANLLTNDILVKLGKIYEVDFQYFGYNPEDLDYVQTETLS